MTQQSKSRFTEALFTQQEEAASDESSSHESEEDKKNGLGELRYFIKQIGLRQLWPRLRRYLTNNEYFKDKESCSVVGFANKITKVDLELALEDV